MYIYCLLTLYCKIGSWWRILRFDLQVFDSLSKDSFRLQFHSLNIKLDLCLSIDREID